LLQHISEVGNETEEKQLHHYLQKTIDGSEDDETYAYDGGIMLVELGYEVPSENNSNFFRLRSLTK
jgi:hypothetical protein